VRQELAHRDIALALRGERREVCRHRLLEPYGATLDLLHHQDRGEQLGHRGHVEDRVVAHGDPLVARQLGPGAVGITQGVAAGLAGHDVTVVPQQGDGTGKQRVRRARGLFPGGDPGQGVVDRLGIKSGVGWRAVSQHGGRAGKARVGLVVARPGCAVRQGRRGHEQRSTDQGSTGGRDDGTPPWLPQWRSHCSSPV